MYGVLLFDVLWDSVRWWRGRRWWWGYDFWWSCCCRNHRCPRYTSTLISLTTLWSLTLCAIKCITYHVHFICGLLLLLIIHFICLLWSSYAYKAWSLFWTQKSIIPSTAKKVWCIVDKVDVTENELLYANVTDDGMIQIEDMVVSPDMFGVMFPHLADHSEWVTVQLIRLNLLQIETNQFIRIFTAAILPDYLLELQFSSDLWTGAPIGWYELVFSVQTQPRLYSLYDTVLKSFNFHSLLIFFICTKTNAVRTSPLSFPRKRVMW